MKSKNSSAILMNQVRLFFLFLLPSEQTTDASLLRFVRPTVGDPTTRSQAHRQLDVRMSRIRVLSVLCSTSRCSHHLQGTRDLDEHEGARGKCSARGAFPFFLFSPSLSFADLRLFLLQVVYGDTDSVFVNSNVTDYNEAIKMANLFKKQVNDKYRLLEIDLDAVFQRLLLLQKKKYAAIKVGNDGTSTQEVKGLDMKRREYCDLSKNVSK